MNHAFENEIFHAFRERERKIKEAIIFLKKNEYVIYKKTKV